LLQLLDMLHKTDIFVEGDLFRVARDFRIPLRTLGRLVAANDQRRLQLVWWLEVHGQQRRRQRRGRTCRLNPDKSVSIWPDATQPDLAVGLEAKIAAHWFRLFGDGFARETGQVCRGHGAYH